jgi:hypothetical protein
VAPRRVAAGRLVWIDLVRRGASPEERRGDFGRFLVRDALAGIFQVALLAADLQVSVHRERPARESMKTLLDALHPEQAVVPATLLGRMAAGSGAQFLAQWVKPRARPVERRPEAPSRPVKQMDASQMQAGQPQLRVLFALEQWARPAWRHAPRAQEQRARQASLAPRLAGPAWS